MDDAARIAFNTQHSAHPHDHERAVPQRGGREHQWRQRTMTKIKIVSNNVRTQTLRQLIYSYPLPPVTRYYLAWNRQDTFHLPPLHTIRVAPQIWPKYLYVGDHSHATLALHRMCASLQKGNHRDLRATPLEATPSQPSSAESQSRFSRSRCQ